MGNLFDTLLIHPIINMLVVLYQALLLMHIPYALGFAIILLTAVIRLLLYPLMATQLKASKKMQELTPHMKALKERHKGDNKKLQEAQMQLYKDHGVNPAAGCLPILIQFPLLIALYNVLSHVVAMSPKDALGYLNGIVYVDTLKLQTVWDTSFFGLPLGKHPSALMETMPAIILVAIITGALQFVQSKMMIPAKAETSQEDKKSKKKAKNEAKAVAPKEDAADFAQAFQTQSLYIFPIMIGFFAHTFPIGLSLYWNTFTLFGILQQYQIAGPGGLKDLFTKKK